VRHELLGHPGSGTAGRSASAPGSEHSGGRASIGHARRDRHDRRAHPQTAAGNVLHGFLLDRDGDFEVIDHPAAATTIGPRLPFTGTNLAGVDDHGDIVGAYEDASRVVHNFLRTGRGSPRSPTRRSLTSTTGARSSASSTTTATTPPDPKASCAPGAAATRPSRSPVPRPPWR
jgi:hypothetical protein